MLSLHCWLLMQSVAIPPRMASHIKSHECPLMLRPPMAVHIFSTVGRHDDEEDDARRSLPRLEHVSAVCWSLKHPRSFSTGAAPRPEQETLLASSLVRACKHCSGDLTVSMHLCGRKQMKGEI
jgi:hypothetical protein